MVHPASNIRSAQQNRIIELPPPALRERSIGRSPPRPSFFLRQLIDQRQKQAAWVFLAEPRRPLAQLGHFAPHREELNPQSLALLGQLAAREIALVLLERRLRQPVLSRHHRRARP